jgi:sugar phosphate isomerase/epimerase
VSVSGDPVMVELAITPDGRWEADTADLIAAAAGAGFAALGISMQRADSSARDAYRAAGLRCHEVLALILSDDEPATMATAEQLAEAAARMDADWILTIFRSPLSSATAKIIQRCAAMFADAGSGMAVEFSPLGPISSIATGLDVVRAGNRSGGRAALMIDSWHFCFGDSTWDDLATVSLEEIAYIQFSDALAPESDKLMKETMNRRALPGEGILELDRFASTLLERGYDGTVSVEVLSAELRALPINEISRRLHATTSPYWS